MRILAVSGSLQDRSSNDALLTAAAELGARSSPGVQVVRSISTAEVPAFNPDLERDGAPAPASVSTFRAQVAAADGVLIATPEYAHSLPGALKNALDWLVGSGDLYGKPVAVLAASPRPDGAQLGRAALEQTLRAQGAAFVVSTTVTVSSTEFRERGLGAGPRREVGVALEQLVAAATEGRRA